MKLFQSLLKDDKRSVVFGVEGIGKRISSLLFAHLSAVITEFKLREDPQQVAAFVDIAQFSRIPKVLYHSIESPFEPADVIRHVWMQLSEFDFPLEEHQLYLASQKESSNDEESLKFLSSLLERTRKKCEEKGIPLCIVVNQANVYSGLA